MEYEGSLSMEIEGILIQVDSLCSKTCIGFLQNNEKMRFVPRMKRKQKARETAQ